MIVVPPLVGALPPKSWVTVGALTYVNSSAGTMAEVPAAVVTVMSTVPVPGGDASMTILPAVFERNGGGSRSEVDRSGRSQIRAGDRHLGAAGRQPRRGRDRGDRRDSCCGGGRHPDEGQRHPEGAQAQSQRERPLYETHRTHNQRVQPTLGHRTPPLGLSASRLHPSATSPGAEIAFARPPHPPAR